MVLRSNHHRRKAYAIERFDKPAGFGHDSAWRRSSRPHPERSDPMIRWMLALALSFGAPLASAADIGQIKVAKGTVTLERAGTSIPAAVGTRLQSSDVVKTGSDGSVGITMTDNSLLSAGPNSVLALDRYEFDEVTSEGHFDASLGKGTLAVVSGRLAKQSRDAMKIRTPAAVLGVRGTELLVSVHDAH
jgi:hypothetical protein